MARPNKSEAILDATESLSRTLGFRGLTIRDVADKVGVKPAAVHYHFRSKEDLMLATMRRYTERLFVKLGSPTQDPELKLLVQTFQATASQPEAMCLGGVIASEVDGLPDSVRDEIKTFFSRLIHWIAQALSHTNPDLRWCDTRALAVTSLLQGAMLTARALDDLTAFERASTMIPALLSYNPLNRKEFIHKDPRS